MTETMTPKELLALAEGNPSPTIRDALRSYAELLSTMQYFSWNTEACKRWDECDTPEDIVLVAKECGWPGLEEP